MPHSKTHLWHYSCDPDRKGTETNKDVVRYTRKQLEDIYGRGSKELDAAIAYKTEQGLYEPWNQLVIFVCVRVCLRVWECCVCVCGCEC